MAWLLRVEEGVGLEVHESRDDVGGDLSDADVEGVHVLVEGAALPGDLGLEVGDAPRPTVEELQAHGVADQHARDGTQVVHRAVEAEGAPWAGRARRFGDRLGQGW